MDNIVKLSLALLFLAGAAKVGIDAFGNGEMVLAEHRARSQRKSAEADAEPKTSSTANGRKAAKEPKETV
jgi:hypothetical protein